MLGFFERKETTHTNLTSPEGNDLNETIKAVGLPTYIPENFKLEDIKSNTSTVISLWSDGNNDIILKQLPIKNSQLNINTENKNYQEAVWGDQAVYYLEQLGVYSAVWHTDEYVYVISAPCELGLQEIEKIIASIELYGFENQS